MLSKSWLQIILEACAVNISIIDLTVIKEIALIEQSSQLPEV